ncbi:MAG: RNA polymerase sigma-70 factor [Ignavibacteriae bacterium]|nr:RNA polymerase sigma-70 factor [Ignavibacteriota bacterium]
MSLIFATTILRNTRERDVDDEDLLQRIARADESALSQLYDRYGQLLYSLGMRILRSTTDAEDVVQEVFLQVWNKAESYQKDKGSVYTWLITMMRNRAIDRLRSKGFKQHIQSVDVNKAILFSEAESSNPHASAVQTEHQQLVINALKQLPEDHRRIFELAYYEGFSQSEIADQLNIPLGTVKSRMRRGLQLMRIMLEEKM